MLRPPSFRTFAAVLAVLSTGLDAQTLVDLRNQARNIDFSDAASTRPFKTGTSLPPTCDVGDAYFKVDAPPGQNLYSCTAADTWTPLSGGSGSLTMADLRDCVSTFIGGDLTVAACAARNGTLDVSVQACTLTLTGASASGTVYAYISGDGIPTIGHSSAATLSCTGWTEANGVSSFPADALPLFTATFSANTWNAEGLTVHRRLLSRDATEAGSGLVSTNNSSTGVTTLHVDGSQVPRYFTGSSAPTQNCTAGRDFYLATSTATLYQCTATNTWSTTVPTVAANRYLPWGVLQGAGVPTAALAANETRWQRFQLMAQMSVNGIGVAAVDGLGGGEGLRFALADASGTILYKTSVTTMCSGGGLCSAALVSPVTLPAGTYYLGLTTDSTTFTTWRLSAMAEGGLACALSDAGGPPIVAGTGSSGSGTGGAVDFGSSMGTLTAHSCNSSENTLIERFHDFYLF